MEGGADMVSVAAGLSGTWALVRGEADWDRRMPMDAGAVFGSFWAVPLSLPAIVLSAEAARRAVVATPELAEAADAGSASFVALAAVVGALLCWGGSLFLLTRLAAKSDKGWRVSPLIVGYNWSRLISNLVIGLFAVAAVLSSFWQLMLLASLVKAALVLWLDVAVIRGALALTTGQAAGAVAMVLLARLVAILLGDVALGALAGVFQV